MVTWESAQITLDEQGRSSTSMKRVKGKLYQNGKDASDFQSDTGAGNQSSGDLSLSGHVLVTSLLHQTTLRCDTLHYSSKGRQIVQTLGNVEVAGDWGTVSGLQEVLATPDLKTFATPDLFPK
ncbi:MAG: hypothetical protein QOJ65_1622 [Fimbriimonadaceae bacterium]|jgi:hypothetical protein|nr:hypothetical protein [Fimbriimonadaceae bacterium]